MIFRPSPASSARQYDNRRAQSAKENYTPIGVIVVVAIDVRIPIDDNVAAIVIVASIEVVYRLILIVLPFV